MKKILFQIAMIGYFSFCNICLFAQGWKFKMGDKWFNENQGLKVGDTMPEMNLGEVLNNKTSKTKLSDFKGKLVILDMWSSTCSSCIALFPEMERLQKEFGDKIQIFLVNPYETKQRIESSFKQRNELFRNQGNSKRATLPDLPCIVNAKELYKLLPARFVPHHIWIDQNGIIRARGPELTTSRKNISDFLQGKDIKFIRDDNTTPRFNKSIAYHNILGKPMGLEMYETLITPYYTDYSARSGGSIVAEFDSINKVYRSTWINTQLLDIYFECFKRQKEEFDKHVIFSSYYQYLPYILNVTDTSRYTDQYISVNAYNFKMTDTDFVKSRFCYEQIAPISMPEKSRMINMLNDLNRYFGSRYGTHVKIENRKVECYVLSKGTKKAALADSVGRILGPMVKSNYKSIKSAIFPVMHQIRRNNQDKLYLLFNDMSYTGPMDLFFPEISKIVTLSDLISVLEYNQIRMSKEKRDVPFVVFSEIISNPGDSDVLR